MDAEKIQSDIDALLTYMNDDMESLGATINTVEFGFLNNEPDRIAVDNAFSWPEEHLFKIINICNSRRLLKKTMRNFSHVRLTEEGQSRAISVKHGRKRSYELGSSMQISTLNVNGPTQIGNGNIQNIQAALNQLIQKIDESPASDEEKNEAKGHLTKFIEHPLVGSIVGGLAGSLSGLF